MSHVQAESIVSSKDGSVRMEAPFEGLTDESKALLPNKTSRNEFASLHALTQGYGLLSDSVFFSCPQNDRCILDCGTQEFNPFSTLVMGSVRNERQWIALYANGRLNVVSSLETCLVKGANPLFTAKENS